MKQELFEALMQKRVGYDLLIELGATHDQFTEDQLERAQVDSWFD
ncbi:hypothetical protein OAP99_02600 [Flavobacteriaceae bacterium]|nr:hypothetical protein [Flavobacteriaceae bacterium]